MAVKLTETQIITLMNMHQARASEVADAIRAPVEAVSYARWEIKHHGWICTVRYGVCRLCGQPLVIRSHQRIYAYHPACWHAANRDVIDRLKVKQARAAQRAIEAAAGERKLEAIPMRSNAVWTLEDESILLKMIDQPVALTCVVLQRTWGAVVARRRLLRAAIDRN